MEAKIENRNKNNLLLLLAIIAASLLVIWIIMLFDKTDNSGSIEKSNYRTIERTLANSQGYSLFNLLRLDKNFT